MAFVLALLACGCASMGREQASQSGGPSPSFGLNYVPQQSEPPVEASAGNDKLTSRTITAPKPATADLDAPADGISGKKGATLANWLASRDKPQAPRKPLPVSSSAPGAADEQFDQ